jgi:hypothetical protein
MIPMRKQLREVVKDTAAVGLSAAAVGLEIGSEFARKTLDEVSREDPAAAAPPGTSATPSLQTAEPDDEDIKILAYYLWEKAGCPEGRDQEFYFQAEREQRDCKKPDRTRASDLIA